MGKETAFNVTQAILTVAAIAGYVLLTIYEKETAGYVALVGPIVGAGLVAQQIRRRSDHQDKALHEIKQRTTSKV